MYDISKHNKPEYGISDNYLNVFWNGIHTRHYVSGKFAISQEYVRFHGCCPTKFRRKMDRYLNWLGDGQNYLTVQMRKQMEERGLQPIKGVCDSSELTPEGFKLASDLSASVRKEGKVVYVHEDGKKEERAIAKRIQTPINIPSLKRYIVETREVLRKNTILSLDNYERLERCVSFAEFLLEAQENGYFEQIYVRNKTTRLTAVGPSLQNCPREVRNVALSGFVQSDLDNAQPTILTQLKEGLKTFEWYRDNKKEVRNIISNDLDIPVSVVKESLLVLMFGGSQKDNEGNRLKELLGDKLEEWKSHYVIRNMTQELEQATNIIWEHQDKWSRYIGSSAARESLFLRKKALCYILQYYESRIMDALDEITEPISYHYDAIVTKEAFDTAEACQHILDRTGFKVTFDQQTL